MRLFKGMMRVAGVALAVTAGLAGQGASAATPISFAITGTGAAGVGSNYYTVTRAAADYWSSVLTAATPITINLTIQATAFSGRTLAATDPSLTGYTVESIENSLQFHKTSALDDLATANLPTLYADPSGANTAALHVYTPGYTDPVARTGIDNGTRVYDTDGSYNNRVVGLTSAQAKALGVTFDPDHVDGTITFNTGPVFDFDPTDGIGLNTSDALGVAIHEIGHALGFASGVDDYDRVGTGGPDANGMCNGYVCMNEPANDYWWGEGLDLFRYSAAGALDWTTGTSSYFSVDGGATAFLGGYFSTGTYNGDGEQTSHWLDNQYLPDATCAHPQTVPLGILDPTAGRCEAESVTALDLAAFDVLGYGTTVDVLADPGYRMSTAAIARQFGLPTSAVPEPATWAMMVLGFGLLGASRRRCRAITAR